jgi:FdhD protein
VARPAFFSSVKVNTLDLKIFSDQPIKINIPREDISPDRARRNAFHLQRSTELVENFQREESDLAFVILLVIKITVAAKTASRDAFDRGHFYHREFVRLASVMADKIVTGRNVKMADFHRGDVIIAGGSMKANGIGPGQIIRHRQDGTLEYQRDELTIEEPLEIRIGNKTVATTMRTPGHDDELAAGFLISEAIVRPGDKIRKFSRPKTARNRENIMIVDLAAGKKIKLNSAQRFGTISSSCGLCGKETIDAIRQNFAPITSNDFRIDIAVLLSLPEKLRANQSDFARTGGIHAAGVFDSKGESLIVREDIGRHNAVDKAIGRAFLDGKLPLDRHLLLVSGRASFEIVQKALAAGIPIVASVSAPSSLAMEFARESNQTLVGFLRPPSFNIYSHVERIILD